MGAQEKRVAQFYSHGWSGVKRADLAVISGWEKHSLSLLLIKVMLANPAHL